MGLRIIKLYDNTLWSQHNTRWCFVREHKTYWYNYTGNIQKSHTYTVDCLDFSQPTEQNSQVCHQRDRSGLSEEKDTCLSHKHTHTLRWTHRPVTVAHRLFCVSDAEMNHIKTETWQKTHNERLRNISYWNTWYHVHTWKHSPSNTKTHKLSHKHKYALKQRLEGVTEKIFGQREIEEFYRIRSVGGSWIEDWVGLVSHFFKFNFVKFC